MVIHGEGEFCDKVFGGLVRQVREIEKVCVRPLGFVASQLVGLCWRKWCLKGV